MTRFRKEDELAWADADPVLPPSTVAEYRQALVATRQPDGWEAVAAEYRAIIEDVYRISPGERAVRVVMAARGFGRTSLATNLDAIAVNRLALR